MTEPSDLTATQAIRRIRDGRLQPRDLLDSCLARIAVREPAVRSFAFHDPALVRASTPSMGVLHGIPFAVKDVIDTADQPSQYGSPIWQGHRPRADAACVAWARGAGAVVIGKTVTTEFATRTPGPTTNPHNVAHTPGGSSSGSAAGVAACMFPLAFGTQTAGSIIRPAAYCGVVGYKPSYGMIARSGMKVMSESLDTIGVIARSVADCALAVGAVAGCDLGDPDQATGAAPRIGVCATVAGATASPETVALIGAAELALARAGAVLRAQALPAAFDALHTAQPIVMNAESHAAMGWELAHHEAQISTTLRERLHWGATQRGALDAARATMRTLQDRFDAVMDGLDILITPSAPGEAPAGLHSTGEPSFNAAWTALHVPCVTVPWGVGPNGLPLGVQVIGRRGQDRSVLAWAQWVASALAS
jgi:Asp-tRNA(Asn)/Glu-tRNA(Gln) amidotransferase A subunit family amidase